MSYSQSVKDQFLSLRADGLSYAQCANQLHVSRHTLIVWAKEMKPHLDAMQAVRTEELLDQVQLRLDQRILLLAALYHKVRQTIESANLLAPGIPRLFTILLKLNTALDKYEITPASSSPLTARLAGRAEPSAPEIPEEKIEPPPHLEPKTQNIATQSPENKEFIKTEPKLNHPEAFSLPIQNSSNPEPRILNSELSSLSLSDLKRECRKKLNQLKTRAAS